MADDIQKHFWTELAHFKITPLSYWRAGKGITVLKEAPGGNDEEMAGEGLSDDDEEVSLFVQQPIQIEPVASSGKDKKRRSKNSK